MFFLLASNLQINCRFVFCVFDLSYSVVFESLLYLKFSSLWKPINEPLSVICIWLYKKCIPPHELRPNCIYMYFNTSFIHYVSFIHNSNLSNPKMVILK